ncbi:MAG: hypothetical protein QM523_02215 [Candidatus Pacebacteria bacterium]|nr:hypothetical protein [Candidatus Paceibacterota bacterium]
MTTRKNRMPFKLPRRIHINQAEKLEHLEAMVEALKTRTPADEQLMEILIRNVATIDIKAQSMLAFNSLIIASQTIIYATTKQPTVKAILAVSFLFILFSSLKALMVLNFEIATTESLKNIKQMKLNMLELRNQRAYDFHILRFCSFLAFIGFAIAMMASFILEY